MLFNSFVFILAFLPATWLGYLLFRKLAGPGQIIIWLSLASLFFYGWWNPFYLPLLVGSICFNFLVGRSLSTNPLRRRGLLAFAVVANLLVLGVFKYAAFAVSNISVLLNIPLEAPHIVLPLGISFFTFTQIAFLVDAHRGKATESDFLPYTLFVTYFPHLIAGPIIHHKEMMPQFKRGGHRSLSANMSVGLALFIFGLFKKVVIADSLAPFVGSVFSVASHGGSLTIWEAWFGALAYTLQLYFDFSGYSEMALGLSCMFEIRLPINFNSPYRATNIIEFWRRWHMTLSRFLRDYLYIGLGGNRRGKMRRYLNLMITMVLGGLWHGAGWTFVLWGGLHGLYLCINHLWRWFCRRVPGGESYIGSGSSAGNAVAHAITFLAVVVAWVFFRAESVEGALQIFKALIGGNGVIVPTQIAHLISGLPKLGGLAFGGVWPNIPAEIGATQTAFIVAALLPVTWFAPNVIQIMRMGNPALGIEGLEPNRLQWRPTAGWAVLLGILGAMAIIRMLLSAPSEFLYFQF